MSSGKALTPAEVAEIENNNRVMVNQAANVAKMKGDMSAALKRLVDEITTVETPWHEKLRYYMQNFVKGDYSWRRPSRRYIASGLYMPSLDRVPRMGEVVVAMDTSGSIGGEEIKEFFGHLNKILEDVLPEKTHLIYCDARAFYGAEFTTEDLPIMPSQQNVQGGGGTSFRPVFAMVEERGISPDVLIYLTDGYGDQSVCTDPGYPVIWATTAREDDYTFGTVLPIKMGDKL
jgi:predicted metal-dependent peptidase